MELHPVGGAMTITQVVFQFQQQLHSSSCCTSPEKDVPSLIDVNGLGVQGNYLAGKRISNSGRERRRHFLLEWSAEQTTEISTEFVDREFLPTATN